MQKGGEIDLNAVWFTYKDLEAFSKAIGFSNAVDDKVHWRFEKLDGFDSKWEARRWLPREARNKNYYRQEYRFSNRDPVGVYKYTYDGKRFFEL